MSVYNSQTNSVIMFASVCITVISDYSGLSEGMLAKLTRANQTQPE